MNLNLMTRPYRLALTVVLASVPAACVQNVRKETREVIPDKKRPHPKPSESRGDSGRQNAAHPKGTADQKEADKKESEKNTPGQAKPGTCLHAPELCLSLVSNWDNSILVEIEKARKMQGTSNISYPLCAFSDLEVPITAAKRESVRATVERAANRWNTALIGTFGWSVTAIKFYLVGSSIACPDSHQDLRVYKIKGSRDIEGSIPYAKEFYTTLGARSGGASAFDKLDYNTLLHEYGHQLGLNDGYTVPGTGTPNGQPMGIMNSPLTVQDLTRDDISSVRQVWAYLGSQASASPPKPGTPASTPSQPNASKTYTLTSHWLGDTKCLDILNHGSRNELRMNPCGDYSGQLWQTHPIAGSKFVKLKTTFTGADKCLDIRNDATANQVQMAACGDYSGQYWQVVPTAIPDFYLLKTQMLGDNKCLDIVNDPTTAESHQVKVLMTACGDYSGQAWKLRER